MGTTDSNGVIHPSLGQDPWFNDMETNLDLLSGVVASSDQLAGPAFVSAGAYSDTAAVVLNAAESLSDGTGVWGSNRLTPVGVLNTATDPAPAPALSTTLKTTGTSSVTARLNSGSSVLDAKLYVDLPAPVAVADHALIAIDVAVDALGASSTGGAGWNCFSVTAATSTALTGTLATTRLTILNITAEQTFFTIVVDASTLSTVRSIGVLKTDPAGSSAHNARWWIDNVRFLAATGIDQAARPTGARTILVPSSYTTAVEQHPIFPGSTKSFLDLRPDRIHGGALHVNDWHIDDTGASDVSAELSTIMNGMADNTTLLFNPQGQYRLDTTIEPTGLRGVTFDAQGARFFCTVQRNESFFRLHNSFDTTFRNFRLFGLNEETVPGNQLEVVAGSPAISGSTYLLDTQNECVGVDGDTNDAKNRWARDKDGVSIATWVLQDTAQVANDCIIEWVSQETDPGITGDTWTSVKATQTLTLTSTPTAYSLPYTITDLDERVQPRVRKATATTNTITVASFYSPNKQHYEEAYETGNGFACGHNCVRCLWENNTVEGVSGDGFQCSGEDNKQNTIRNMFVRCSGRQGISLNKGDDWVLEDFVCREGRRHGLDIEPETPNSHLKNPTVRNGIIWNQVLGCMIVQSPQRIDNLNVHNIVTGGSGQTTKQNDFSVASTGGHVSNISQHFTGVPITGGAGDVFASFQVKGRNMRVDNIYADTFVEIDGTQYADDLGGFRDTGGHHISNITVARPTMYTNVRCEAQNCTIDGVSATNVDQDIYPGQGGGLAPQVGPVEVQADTIFTGLDLGPHRAAYGNTYKGLASVPLWYPNGQDLFQEPSFNVRGLSGGATKGNNLGGVGVAITNGATTKTVAFPARTYSNPTSVTTSNGTGGTLPTTTVHYYRIAGRPRYGGPRLPITEFNKGTGSFTTIIMTINGLVATADELQIDGLTFYRGLSAGGPYSMRAEWPANLPFASVKNATIITDLGPTLSWTADSRTWGYPASVTWAAGTYTPVDETGFEPDASYGVMVMPTWATTVRVTAKRTNGFDLSFGTAAGASDTIDWFIYRGP